ncbi:MAG TPA: DUF1549 domain-containing protein, partial [Planctomycetota bacterium]
VPGDPGASWLVQRILAEDPEDRMPPADAGKQLTAAEIETLRRWVEEGAEWRTHWAYEPPVRPDIAPVRNQAWVRNPIDSFVLAKLEAEGLDPAPEADRRTLIRRVSFDLTGLPPSPAELEAFVADAHPDAYERLVDRLLASERWGEHRARYWLDAARYADTHGFHIDAERSLWRWRDWVIGAFNSNLPFDQFTVEQLAGDLLPDPTPEQRIATGFHRNNPTTGEGGLIEEEYLVKYAIDRLDTTATVWLGQTMACAQCHDHKFDPFSQKEFYSFFAYFHNVAESGSDANALVPPPILPAPSAEQILQQTQRKAAVAQAESEFATLSQTLGPQQAVWEAETTATLAALSAAAGTAAVAGLPFELEDAALGADRLAHFDFDLETAGESGRLGGGAVFSGPERIEIANVGDFERDQAFSYGGWIRPRGGNAGQSPIARMDDAAAFRGWDLFLDGARPAAHLIHAWPDDALKVRARQPLPQDRWSHVFVTYDGSSTAAGVGLYVDGHQVEVDVQADQLESTIRTNVATRIGGRTSSAGFTGDADDLRIYGRALSAQDVAELAAGFGVAWERLVPSSATAESATELTVLPDGSVLGGGEVPATDVQTIACRTELTDLNAVRLE